MANEDEDDVAREDDRETVLLELPRTDGGFLELLVYKPDQAALSGLAMASGVLRDPFASAETKYGQIEIILADFARPLIVDDTEALKFQRLCLRGEVDSADLLRELANFGDDSPPPANRAARRAAQRGSRRARR